MYLNCLNSNNLNMQLIDTKNVHINTYNILCTVILYYIQLCVNHAHVGGNKFLKYRTIFLDKINNDKICVKWRRPIVRVLVGLHWQFSGQLLSAI